MGLANFCVPDEALDTEALRFCHEILANSWRASRAMKKLVADTDGELLRNPDRAWEVARDMIRELLRTEGANAALLSAVIEVTDEEGDVVLEFPFAEAIFDLPDQSATRH